jgi:hypothetical protein
MQAVVGDRQGEEQGQGPRGPMDTAQPAGVPLGPSKSANDPESRKKLEACEQSDDTGQPHLEPNRAPDTEDVDARLMDPRLGSKSNGHERAGRKDADHEPPSSVRLSDRSDGPSRRGSRSEVIRRRRTPGWSGRLVEPTSEGYARSIRGVFRTRSLNPRPRASARTSSNRTNSPETGWRSSIPAEGTTRELMRAPAGAYSTGQSPHPMTSKEGRVRAADHDVRRR